MAVKSSVFWNITGESEPTYRMDITSPFSGLERNRSKKPGGTEISVDLPSASVSFLLELLFFPEDAGDMFL
jgi:hypothetical protein